MNKQLTAKIIVGARSLCPGLLKTAPFSILGGGLTGSTIIPTCLPFLKKTSPFFRLVLFDYRLCIEKGMQIIKNGMQMNIQDNNQDKRTKPWLLAANQN